MQGANMQAAGQQLDRIQAKLRNTSVFVQFQESQLAECSIKEEAAEDVASLLQRYEGLAFEYLRKLIECAHVPQKNQQTRQSFSYFFEESIKIVNTKHFPFFNILLELNFIDFLSKLQRDVKDKGGQALESKFDDLLKDNELCSLFCVGCNRFYYQYFPLEMNVTKRSYELIFLRSITQEMKAVAFAKPQKVDPSIGFAIDLLRLEDSIMLLKQMVFVLNNNGGFIVVGCKKIQDFHAIKQSYTPHQLFSRYINAQFVIGESLNQQRKDRISEGLLKLTRKITPFVEPQRTITLSFVPIKPSLFELGFDLETLKLDQQVFQKKQMHLVVIKIDPALSHYGYRLNQDRELQFQQYDTELQVQPNHQEADIDAYLKQMREGMSEEEELEEAFCMQPQVSYFQSHHNCRFQPFSK